MVWKEDIINQNLWWKHGMNFTIYDKDMVNLSKEKVEFKRKKIRFEKGNIYVIRGPRRVGKTVFVKQTIMELLKNNANSRQILYFSCEALPSKKKEQLRRIIKIFLEAGEFDTYYIFLDEITYVTDWQIELKYLYDIGLLSNSIVCVTGSTSSVIKEKVEYLPGRGVEGNEYLLKPLSFRDFIFGVQHVVTEIVKEDEKRNAIRVLIENLKDLKITFEEDSHEMAKVFHKIYPFASELKMLFNIYILTGGFPKAINNIFQNLSKGIKTIDNLVYEEIVNYVLGDIAKMNKSDEIAKQVLIGVLRRLGSRYSYTAIGKEVREGIEHSTLISYLNVLENSFIIQTLCSYDFNKKSGRIKGNKKVYFVDPFILHAINSMFTGKSGFDFANEYIENEENISKVVESIIASHLQRIKEIPKMKESSTFLWFYYDKKGKEIDFIYKKENNKYLGLEVKYQYDIKKNDVTKISPVKDYILLSQETFDPSDTALLVIPAYVFLSLLEISEKGL